MSSGHGGVRADRVLAQLCSTHSEALGEISLTHILPHCTPRLPQQEDAAGMGEQEGEEEQEKAQRQSAGAACNPRPRSRFCNSRQLWC